VIQTLLDRTVFLASIPGLNRDLERALGLLDPANRVFRGSAFVDLELTPKAAFHKQTLESGGWEHPEAPQRGARERDWRC